jgi:hypothetical protein
MADNVLAGRRCLQCHTDWLICTLSVPPSIIAETVADTLAWDQERGQPDLRTGLSAEMERELLATWHSRR